VLGFHSHTVLRILQDAMKRAAERDLDLAIKAAAMRAKRNLVVKRRAVDGWVTRFRQEKDLTDKANAFKCATCGTTCMLCLPL